MMEDTIKEGTNINQDSIIEYLKEKEKRDRRREIIMPIYWFIIISVLWILCYSIIIRKSESEISKSINNAIDNKIEEVINEFNKSSNKTNKSNYDLSKDGSYYNL